MNRKSFVGRIIGENVSESIFRKSTVYATCKAQQHLGFLQFKADEWNEKSEVQIEIKNSMVSSKETRNAISVNLFA